MLLGNIELFQLMLMMILKTYNNLLFNFLNHDDTFILLLYCFSIFVFYFYFFFFLVLKILLYFYMFIVMLIYNI